MTLINQYMVLSYLGQGSSGRVYLCMDIHDSHLYAVKVGRHTMVQMLQLNLSDCSLGTECAQHMTTPTVAAVQCSISEQKQLAGNPEP